MKIMVAGCAGRMGREVIRAVGAAADVTLTSGYVLADDRALGRDLGELAGIAATGAVATADLVAAVAVADAIIDFSSPALTLELAALAALEDKILVTGTTGLSDAQQKELEHLADQAAIVQSFNMSMGVNLLAALVEQTAARLNEEFDIEILELHHRHKVDAPSGTALLLGRAAAAGRGVALDEVADKVRSGHTGPRESGHIGFAVLRGGDAVGEHTVIFAGDDERIELAHKSSRREIYAKGAVRAALWAQGKGPGLYSMRDVLGL